MKNKSVNTYIVYVIAMVTILLLTPFIFIFSNEAIKNNIRINSKDGDEVTAPVIVNKVYSNEDSEVNLSKLDKKYTIITQKALNNNVTLIFCSEKVDYIISYETMRIVTADGYGNIDVADINISGRFLDNVKNGNYSYNAFNDNTFFISDNHDGYLIDTETLKIVARFRYPIDMDIHEAAISNDKTAVAITSANGLYLADIDMKSIKELVASVQDINGSVTGPRYPVWSGTDNFIYYTLYTDATPRFPGRTTLAPGGNETYTTLTGFNTTAINEERIFYYHSSATEGNTPSSFTCGFFNAATKTLSDMINSSVNYFNTKVSTNGSLFAALSYNGLMQKLNIIDPVSKQLIYSENFGKVISFDFSPDERGILVLAENEGKQIVKTIQINWHTVEY